MNPLAELRTAARAILVLTVLLGIAYPLAITGVAQSVFPDRADGSPIRVGGKLVGSKLLGRAYVIDTGRKDADGNAITRPDPRYFQPRPSATGYSGTATFFSNRGPNSAVARFFYRDQVSAYLALERPYDRSLRAATIPIDAVTTSASGVDPGITRTNAAIQAHRVAAQRRLPLARVMTLVRDSTDGRFLGVFGERQVDVVALNAALDKEAS